MGTPKARRRKRLKRIEALAKEININVTTTTEEASTLVEEKAETTVTKKPSALKMIPKETEEVENIEVISQKDDVLESPKPKPKANKVKATTKRSTRPRKTPQRAKNTTKTNDAAPEKINRLIFLSFFFLSSSLLSKSFRSSLFSVNSLPL